MSTRQLGLSGMLLIALMAGISGCTTIERSEPALAEASPDAKPADSFEQNRMLVWRAWLTVEVSDVGKAMSEIEGIARQSGGYIESKNDSGEQWAGATIRVPTDNLSSTMALLESVGEIKTRRVSSEDVTDQYVDVDARVKTMIDLRDRLRALLDKAQDVKDILAIEKELSRVQADIESMQARLKALKGKADLATVSISIRRQPILGPLGYLLKGTFWSLSKLFVIRE